MRVVTHPGPGIFEVNYMWLPSWIGMNPVIMDEMGKKLKPLLEGRTVDDDLLDEAHDLVVNWLVEKFPSVVGLREHLEHLKQVTIDEQE